MRSNRSDITSQSAILFDAVGTLIYADPQVAEVYHAAGHRFGSSMTADCIRMRFCEALACQEQADSATRHITSEANERNRWRKIVAHVFHDLQNTEALFQSLWDYFAQPHHWRLYDDVMGCWQSLAETGYVLGVASNFDERLDAILESNLLSAWAGQRTRGLTPPARHFVSSRIGHKKPSLEFFRAIERELGLPPEQLLLVGDDLENDYHAARRAGWQAVLLERDIKTSSDHIAEKLNNLKDLPSLLDRRQKGFLTSATAPRI